MPPLPWQVVQVPLSGGIQTKEDARASDPRQLDVAEDLQFEELLGVQTRLPYVAMPNAIFGGGTLANCRRIDVVNGELVLQTSSAIYSWNARLSTWVLRATYLAAAIEETPVFATAGDQIDGDRAELDGTVVFAWTEGTAVFAAALDKATGSVLVPPTAVAVVAPGTSTAFRPKLVALATKIMLLNIDFNPGAPRLVARAIDPLNPAPGIVATPTILITSGGTLTGMYDAVRVDSQDLLVGAATFTSTTGYVAFTLTPLLAIAVSNKARATDGPIAVASPPGGVQTQIVRSNSTAILGDFLTTTTLADVHTAQAIGTALFTPVNQIAAAHRTVQTSSAFRCYVFWSSGESTSSGSWTSQTSWVDTAGALGTTASFAGYLGVGSRAFAGPSGSVFVWLTFGGATGVFGSFSVASVPAFQLQNTYFLYRDDAFLVAKCVASHGGGLQPNQGQLPGVQMLSSSSFAWCATQRRRLALANGGRGFAAREPVDVHVTFDSVNARRSATIGGTLYIAGGEIMQYDGVQLVELGTHIYPWTMQASSGSGGAITPGTYTYKFTARYPNAQGEQDRSTTATDANVSITTATSVSVSTTPVTPTHKLVVPPALEVWRTQGNPGDDAPFYLVSSNDPTVIGTPNNRYIPNSVPPASPPLFTPTFTDLLADAAITLLEQNPENGSVLENVTPPPAQIAIATDVRIFLAGIAGAPDTVWASMQRIAGAVAQFNDALTVDVPRPGGAITALAYLNETLVVFRETSIYALPGIGFDNTGGGQNFGPANRLSGDVGAVSAESVVFTPLGIVFKSAKGWYVLDRSWNPQYIGGPVNAFDADVPLAAHIVEGQHQVRLLTNNRMLVWDYYWALESPSGNWAQWGAWSPWSVTGGVHATIWQGAHIVLTSTGPLVQHAAFDAPTGYGIDAETVWLKNTDLQNAVKCRAISVLGEYRSSCAIRIRVARDYQYDSSGKPLYFDDVVWTPEPAIVGSALQVHHSLTQTQFQTIKVRITAVTIAAMATLATSTLDVLTNLTPWHAVLQAVPLGEMGNAITFSITFEDGALNLIDVRDHFAWSLQIQRWIETPNNVGVRVVGNAMTPPTIAQLEAAIAVGAPQLVTILTPDASGSVIAIASLDGVVGMGQFTGGAYGAPTGEAVKLTGVALEVLPKPGLYRRLPAAQKV